MFRIVVQNNGRLDNGISRNRHRIEMSTKIKYAKFQVAQLKFEKKNLYESRNNHHATIICGWFLCININIPTYFCRIIAIFFFFLFHFLCLNYEIMWVVLAHSSGQCSKQKSSRFECFFFSYFFFFLCTQYYNIIFIYIILRVFTTHAQTYNFFVLYNTATFISMRLRRRRRRKSEREREREQQCGGRREKKNKRLSRFDYSFCFHG